MERNHHNNLEKFSIFLLLLVVVVVCHCLWSIQFISIMIILGAIGLPDRVNSVSEFSTKKNKISPHIMLFDYIQRMPAGNWNFKRNFI